MCVLFSFQKSSLLAKLWGAEYAEFTEEDKKAVVVRLQTSEHTSPCQR